jgi:drug/metabolite transporter (DMT)-like permease
MRHLTRCNFRRVEPVLIPVMTWPARTWLSRTVVFLAIAVLANSFGNLLMALGMGRMPDFGAVPCHSYLLGLLDNPYLLPGALLTAVYTITQLSLLSWADLSYVVPCIASSYIVSTLLGEFVLDERVRAIRWAGVVLIFLGVTLVYETTPATTSHGRDEIEGS